MSAYIVGNNGIQCNVLARFVVANETQQYVLVFLLLTYM